MSLYAHISVNSVGRGRRSDTAGRGFLYGVLEKKRRKEGERKGKEGGGGRSLYVSISTREKYPTHKANEQERRGDDYY